MLEQLNHRREIFSGRDIRVIAYLTDDTDLIVVTFSGRGESGKFGFGETFLTKNGISNVNFISLANHWWQTAEMFLAIEIVKEVLEPFNNVACYGSSMGGYAAVNYADLLGANRVFCFSPQASAVLDGTPFERRWISDREKLKPLHDMLWKQRTGRAVIDVIYDNFDQDRQHVMLFDGPDVRHNRIPLVGHSTCSFLAQAGLLSTLSLAFLRGEDPWPTARSAVLRKRRLFSHYWFNMLKRAIARRRVDLARNLCRIATTLQFKKAEEWLELAAFAEKLLLQQEALLCVERAVELNANATKVDRRKSSIYFKFGDLFGAFTILERLCALPVPAFADLKRMIEVSGKVGEAVAKADAIAAVNRHYPDMNKAVVRL